MGLTPGRAATSFALASACRVEVECAPAMIATRPATRPPQRVGDLVLPLFPRQPLGGAHGAFGESAARLGLVAQIDSTAGRIEDHLMHADHVPLAKGNDLDFFFLASGLAHNFLDRDGSSGRSVFFLRMMTLENRSEENTSELQS